MTQSSAEGGKAQSANAAEVMLQMEQDGASDEQVKAVLAGGPDAERSDKAFETAPDGLTAVRPALDYFFQPTAMDLEQARKGIESMLKRWGHVIVPMRETRPVVGPVLEYLCSRVDPCRVIVADCGSQDAALGAVAQFLDRGVHLFHHDEALGLLDWDRLLPYLNLPDPPTVGKGVTVMAGMIALRVLYPRAAAVVQHDSDVREPDRYDCLAALAYPMTRVKRGDRVLYAKVSRPGRGNEATMSARNILFAMATNPAIPEHIRRLALHRYLTLLEHKWMLTGEFGLFGRLAFNRPFATGYLEETLISMFVEDCIAFRRNGHHEVVVQVEALLPRVDDANDDRKEFRMMDRICRFLIESTLYGKALPDWTLEDFQRFNVRFGALTTVARIPSREDGAALHGPVIVENLVQDRIIPGIKMLEKGEFFIKDRVAAFRAKYQR